MEFFDFLTGGSEMSFRRFMRVRRNVKNVRRNARRNARRKTRRVYSGGNNSEDDTGGELEDYGDDG